MRKLTLVNVRPAAERPPCFGAGDRWAVFVPMAYAGGRPVPDEQFWRDLDRAAPMRDKSDRAVW
jgi:hypothetical protein